MTTVFLTSASSSPWSKPGNWNDAGHTVELVGCGAQAGAGSNGTSGRGGGGGGGGAYVPLTYSSGTTGSSVPFEINTNSTTTTDGTTNATVWESTTITNGYYAECGRAGSTTTAGAAGSATTTSNGTPSPVTYTVGGTKHSGGAGGASSTSVIGGGGGGGGAGGPAAIAGAGAAGGTTAGFGGGGGGAGNATSNGAAVSSASGSAGGTGVGPSHGGGAGSTTTVTGNGSAGIGGQGGGGGCGFSTTTASQVVSGYVGGPNGNASNWVQTSDSATAGTGGGGGGAGGSSGNVTCTMVGGNGGNYGGGGGGPGGSRGTGTTQTRGSGASGLIVITYTGAYSFVAGAGSYSLAGVAASVLGPNDYKGPGDIVSGAAGWWGLRAYSNAKIGTNAVRLRESGGNTEQDFATIAGGGLDLAAIATFKGANNLFIVKLYDQTGNSSDQVQATAANQPAFTLGGLGALPTVTFGGSQELNASPVPNTSQPYTLSVVYEATTTVDEAICGAGGAFQVRLHSAGGGANSLLIYAGTVPANVTVSDNFWHAVQAVFNGSASDINVDGNVNTVSPGANSTGALICYGSLSGLSIPFIGPSVELGFWGSAFTSTQSTNVSANQRKYWLVKSILAATRAYVLTGSDSVRQQKRTAAVGSYALTGIASIHAVSMPAVAGAYALTGGTANQKQKRTASVGAYALTGVASLHVVTMPAVVGSYILTGGVALKKQSRTASVGAYTLGGGTAVRQLKRTAAVGSYALTGGIALKKQTRAASTGSYALTGVDATLTRSAAVARTLVAAAGSYALTYGAVALRRTFSYRLACSAGNYWLRFDMEFDPAFLSAGSVLSNRNLTVTGGNSNDFVSTRDRRSLASGKHYCEFHVDALNNNAGVGVCNGTQTTVQSLGGTAQALGYFSDGNVWLNSSIVLTLETYTAGDVIGVQIDCDAQVVSFLKNGVSPGVYSLGEDDFPQLREDSSMELEE